jgi:thioredoxin 1
MRSWRHYGIGLVGLIVGLSMVWGTLPVLAGPAPSQGKPALYEFGAKTCIPCKQMKEVMAGLKGQYSDQVEFRMVYVDEERPLFGQYKIVAIPTQVFLDASGKEVDRHMGALPKEEVIKKLKELKFIAH